ncbi:MAG: hypothetical protein ACRESJ_23770 [Pseudomonas sp.]|uniref:hypothetical protein n=1 Tax=Pseudomonas sp. TaxID=306 RepID=UPI003D6F54F5
MYGSILRIAKLLNLKNCHNSLPSEWVAAVRRLVNREIKETGTSEDVPRTAAITQIAGEKKAPADAWHCCAVIYLGLPSPVAELAATMEGYRPDPFPATFEGLDPKPPLTKNVFYPSFVRFVRCRLTHDIDIHGFYWRYAFVECPSRSIIEPIGITSHRG